MTKADEDAIREIELRFNEAWGRHDPDAMVESLVDDARFVTVNGAWTKTRVGFRDDGTQLALGGVVRHAEASVVDETGERGPEPELTLKRSAKRTSLRNSSVTVGPQDMGLKERNENIKSISVPQWNRPA